MNNAPLMPKATAVWLVENTSLTFDQIADFCKLHPLEVKGIADGEVAAGIKGHDPITSGQLTREEIAKAEKTEGYHLSLAVSKVRMPEIKPRRGARYTPLSRRQDRPNAILWLVRNHPELKDAQIRAAKERGPGPAELGQTLVPAEITTRPRETHQPDGPVFADAPPSRASEDVDLDVDSVFAKLNTAKPRG